MNKKGGNPRLLPFAAVHDNRLAELPIEAPV
jgi:hypothetical protein